MQSTESATAERDRLVRYCAAYTGDAVAAEDLAQQTLLAAWQHEQELRNPAARQAWLHAIARRHCQTWARERTRARLVALDSLGDGETRALPADDFDVETEIERADLARLLDRAMGLLPKALRDVLVQRFVAESPQAQVAARLGLSEGAVEARVQRGKLALRRVLTTELSADAVALGLISDASAGWVETRLWCPVCGGRRLEGRLMPAEGKLFMRCPGCGPTTYDAEGIHVIHAEGSYLRDAHSYKPALARVLEGIHEVYRVQAQRGMAPCPICGRWIPIGRGAPPGRSTPDDVGDSFYLWHAGCAFLDWESWHALTWSLPEARRFWQDNPRMRFLAPREVEHAGSPAVVTGFESLTGSARLDVVTLRDTLQVVRVAGAPGAPSGG